MSGDSSHLPTPLSAGLNSVVLPFFPGVTSPESPLAYSGHRGLGATSSASYSRLRRSHSPIHQAHSVRNVVQDIGIVTPDTSPSSSAKHPETVSTVQRPLSAPLLPSKQLNCTLNVKSDASSLLAAKHALLNLSDETPTKPNSPGDLESSLSSPFMEKLLMIEENDTSPYTEAILVTPQPKPLADSFLSPVKQLDKHPEIVATGESSKSLLNEPFFPSNAGPSRLPGGELARIREELSLAENARISSLESRRPDYLRRRRVDTVHVDGTENDGVGILTSPEKGRRIQLIDFQTTSAESFEESLMTHGYGTYGEPRTPQKRAASSANPTSSDALTWIAYDTPAKEALTPPPHAEESILSEKELKKRKRLQAFRFPSSRASCKLYAVEVEGKGRVLLNVPPEEMDEVLGTPAKKRAIGKKRKAAAEKAKSVTRLVEQSNSALIPNWLDEHPPWALRNKEWADKEIAEAAERMRHIEEYFSRDTDSEEEDKGNDRENDEEVLPSSMWGQEMEDPPVATRRGRGKAVPLQPDPIHPRSTPPLRPIQTAVEERTTALYFPSDPADARAALLSKRSVRLLAHKRNRQSRPYGVRIKRRVDGRIACVCGVEEDDRPSVQCDKCYNWCHLDCIGVKHVSDLGDEDDPWYCPHCRPRDSSPVPSDIGRETEVYRQPTFAPTDDRPVMRSGRDDVALFSSSPQASPTTRYWGSTSLRSPLRPGHGRHARVLSWDDPFHIGPSTPYDTGRNVRVFTPTVGKYGEFSSEDFDSLSAFPSTPSRTTPSVVKLGNPFSTPKHTADGNSAWSSRAGNLFATPRNGRHAIFGSQDEPTSSSSLLYGADDTPVRRAPVHGRAPFDSTLAPRLGLSQVGLGMSFEGSPIEHRRPSGPVTEDGPPSPFDFQPT